MNNSGDTARIIMYTAMLIGIVVLPVIGWIKSKPSTNDQKKVLKQGLIAAVVVPTVFFGLFYLVFHVFLQE